MEEGDVFLEKEQYNDLFADPVKSSGTRLRLAINNLTAAIKHRRLSTLLYLILYMLHNLRMRYTVLTKTSLI